MLKKTVDDIAMIHLTQDSIRSHKEWKARCQTAGHVGQTAQHSCQRAENARIDVREQTRNYHAWKKQIILKNHHVCTCTCTCTSFGTLMCMLLTPPFLLTAAVHLFYDMYTLTTNNAVSFLLLQLTILYACSYRHGAHAVAYVYL